MEEWIAKKLLRSLMVFGNWQICRSKHLASKLFQDSQYVCVLLCVCCERQADEIFQNKKTLTATATTDARRNFSFLAYLESQPENVICCQNQQYWKKFIPKKPSGSKKLKICLKPADTNYDKKQHFSQHQSKLITWDNTNQQFLKRNALALKKDNWNLH